jgi:flagellar biosynthesis chaperone FliJ
MNDKRELYRSMIHAFGHQSDGSHHHINVEQFMEELDRFIDEKICRDREMLTRLRETDRRLRENVKNKTRSK